MNTLLKSLGGIILLLGVGILAIPAFTDIRDNKYLAGGLLIVVLGYILHIILNKKVK